MEPNLSQQLLQSLRWRYATKSFNPKQKITPAQLAALEQALLLTPSSFGLQPWRFLVVTNPELREKLRPHAWNQPQITEASHLIVLCAKTTLNQIDIDRSISHMAAVRSIPEESLAGFKGVIENFVAAMNPEQVLAWNQRQVYCALGNLLTSAAVMGIDACPMEGFAPSGFDELLGLPALGFTTTVLCAVGFRSEADPFAGMAKVRYMPHEVIEHRD
jgi:nitroreductase